MFDFVVELVIVSKFRSYTRVILKVLISVDLLETVRVIILNIYIF